MEVLQAAFSGTNIHGRKKFQKDWPGTIRGILKKGEFFCVERGTFPLFAKICEAIVPLVTLFPTLQVALIMLSLIVETFDDNFLYIFLFLLSGDHSHLIKHCMPSTDNCKPCFLWESCHALSQNKKRDGFGEM